MGFNVSKRELPSCTDRCVKTNYDKYDNLTLIVNDSKIILSLRHMTSEDMDTILANTRIGYHRGLVYNKCGEWRKARGGYIPVEHLIVLDPKYDMNEVLIHEAGHVFYGRFGAYEPNNVRWTEPLFDKTEFIKIAQKHILRTIPDDYYWDVDYIDKTDVPVFKVTY